MKEKPEVRVFLVCTGVTRLSGQKGVVNTFREVTDGLQAKGELLPKQHQWTKIRNREVGCVYSVGVPSLKEFRQSGTIFNKTMWYVRRWHRREEAEGWAAEAGQIIQAVAVEAKASEAEREGGWLSESLKPIRARWQKANALGRAALIGTIIYELDRRDLL